MRGLMRVWTVVLVAGLAGCKAGQPTSGDTAASTSAAIGPPVPVEQAEGLAEDVQTDLAQNAWPAAQAKVRELKSLRQKLDSAGVPQPKQDAYGRAVESLGAAVAARSQSEALTAGNYVSRIITGIMLDYPNRVPVHVVYMDVAGRDVLYAAQQGRWSDAAAPVAEVEKSYAAVQAHVRARNFALDQQVTSEIAQLRRGVASRAPGRVTSVAQALLDDVDRIELTF